MRLLNNKSKLKRTYMSFVVILFAVVSPAWAQNEQNSHQGLLKNVILERPLGRSGVFRFLSPGAGWNPPGPGFAPIIGLSNSNAVPFLVNVLRKGPDWSEDELPRGKADMYRYVARCYAALCLGSIGDSRAFAPLLMILNNKDLETYAHGTNHPRGGEYNLRAYASFALGSLGDRRAVAPLIKSLRQDGFIECIYALARLQSVTAVPVIVQVASDRNMFGNVEIHRCLEYILKVRFTLKTAGEDYRYKVIEQFPEVGTVHLRDAYRVLWKHWMKVGDKYAREQFEKYYPQWKASLKDKTDAPSRHRALQERMLKGGVAAVPYVIAEIEKGDTSIIPVAAKLTMPRARRIKDPDPQLPENATQAKALKWWKENKQKWIIFQSAR